MLEDVSSVLEDVSLADDSLSVSFSSIKDVSLPSSIMETDSTLIFVFEFLTAALVLLPSTRHIDFNVSKTD